MTLTANEVGRMVDMGTGEVSRVIFTDQEIFNEEMRQIFGRAWLFLCHESQIPKAGDFFEAPMGQDNVLVVRQKDGSIRAFINSCTHRGNAVCRAEEGNTKNFMCTYHGWTFDLAGNLVGVPGLERFYSDALDRSKHGLKQVAQLDTYKGFVFGTFDATAPALYDYLGECGRLGVDQVADQGDMVAVAGVQKFVVQCNWKIAVDNIADWYHPQVAHMSAQYAGFSPRRQVLESDAAAPDSGGAETPDGQEMNFSRETVSVENVVVLGEYGHMIGGPPVTEHNFMHAWKFKPGVPERLSPASMHVGGHPNIFPTMWLTQAGQVSLRVPRTPTTTELWWFTFVPKDAPDEEKQARIKRANHIFGPAGLLEQEDGENWAQSTKTGEGYATGPIPHALKMNVGLGQIHRDLGPAMIEGNTNEHAQLWLYGSWAQWMSGSDWQTLRENTLPGDVL